MVRIRRYSNGGFFKYSVIETEFGKIVGYRFEDEKEEGEELRIIVDKIARRIIRSKKGKDEGRIVIADEEFRNFIKELKLNKIHEVL